MSHNILFRDRKIVGILDIDSFKTAPPCVAYGFAAYKLYRQSVVHNPSIINDYSIYQFIEQMQIYANPKLLLKGAMIEVFTRLCIILEPLLTGEKSPWTRVLGIQLLGILEILYFLDSAHE